MVFTLALAALIAGAPAAAQEIYRWVDENGVVNFSQSAPTPDTEGVATVVLEELREPDRDPDEDIFNVEATTARTQALRDEMAERRQAQLEVQRNVARQQVAQPNQVQRYGYPVYWYPPLRPTPPIQPVPPKPEPYPTVPFKPPGRK